MRSFVTVENAITPGELEEDYDVTPEGLSEAMAADVAGWQRAKIMKGGGEILKLSRAERLS